MKKINFREAQLGAYEILKFLDKFCRENNLKYFLMYGSLIGAVRDKGIIPWDDDIDIGMPRKDYEQLIKLEQTEPISPELRLVSDRTGTCSTPFSELIHINTRLERKTAEYIREDCMITQLFIDIIPQDGWPEDEKAAIRLFQKMRRMRYLVQNGRAKLGQGTTFVHRLAKIPFILFARCIGTKRILDKMDCIARTYDYDTSKYVGAVTYGIYGPGERCIRESTVDFKKVEFEGKWYKSRK